MAQHLYLMQNCYGMIKIGRSVDPARRRLQLESDEQCRIEIVAIKPNWGEFEEEILQDLDEHRLVGEWFDGDEVTRTYVLASLGLPDHTEWPFDLNESEAAEWLDRLAQWRHHRSIRRDIHRELELLRQKSIGDRFLDFRVWRAKWQLIHQFNWHVITDNKSGLEHIYRYDGSKPELLPPYTTDTAAALTLWPESSKPQSWSGSTIDCCIAALQAELAILSDRYKTLRSSHAD